MKQLTIRLLGALALLLIATTTCAQVPPGSGVTQSGNVTGGDCASWTRTNVIQDAGSPCGIPGGAAGGDLAGTYPNPTVASATAATAFKVLVASLYGMEVRIAGSSRNVQLRNDGGFSWSLDGNVDSNQDTGLSRPNAGIVSFDTGTVGDGLGTVKATGFQSGSNAGVSCAANTVSLTTLVVTNGIITHC